MLCVSESFYGELLCSELTLFDSFPLSTGKFSITVKVNFFLIREAVKLTRERRAGAGHETK